MKIRSMYFFLFCVACSLKLYGQIPISHADSTIIEKYRYRLNREFIIDEVSKKDRNNRTVIDSLIDASHTRYDKGTTSYSPDKKFKIFVLTGESCGSNCSYINAAYIFVIKERRKVKADLFPVEKIYKLNDGKYLVIQKGLTGAGIYISDIRAATLLSIEGGRILYHHIPYVDPVAKFDITDRKQNENLRLQQYQSNNEDQNSASSKQVLSFHPATKKLIY